jgi:CreA protein
MTLAMLRRVLLVLASSGVSGLRLPPPPSSSTSERVSRGDFLRKAALLAPFALSSRATADDGKIVGQIPASGIVFKDIVKVERFEDPKVTGIELYISDFQRPITDRISKDFFSDPTQAAVTCARIGKMELADDIDTSEQGEQVFSQARSLLFKSVNVRRLYDKEKGTLLYVAYSTRLNVGDDENKSRFKTTMCAIPVQ